MVSEFQALAIMPGQNLWRFSVAQASACGFKLCASKIQTAGCEACATQPRNTSVPRFL